MCAGPVKLLRPASSRRGPYTRAFFFLFEHQWATPVSLDSRLHTKTAGDSRVRYSDADDDDDNNNNNHAHGRRNF